MPVVNRRNLSVIDVMLNDAPGYEGGAKFAKNAAVGTSFEDIWTVSGNMNYQTSAEQVNIVSTSVEDDADKDPAGTGAYTIQVYGLDANYLEIDETITMNGQTNVLTPLSYIRIYRMVVLTAGSTGGNVGTINATSSGESKVMAQIAATDNQTLMCQYTVPSGKIAYFIRGFVSCGKNDDSVFRLLVRPFGQVFQVKREAQVYQNVVTQDFDGIGSFPPKTDITIRAKSGAGGVETTCGYDFILHSQ